eukprot:3426854-Rhodomonas_salina.1
MEDIRTALFSKGQLSGEKAEEDQTPEAGKGDGNGEPGAKVRDRADGQTGLKEEEVGGKEEE